MGEKKKRKKKSVVAPERCAKSRYIASGSKDYKAESVH